MRINKLFGARSITNLLYGLIMFLPFMAILGRVIYTQANANSKDSYSQKTITNVTKVANTNYLLPNSIYQVNDILTTEITGDNAAYNITVTFSYISLDLNTLLNTTDKVYYKFRVTDWSTNNRWEFTYKNEIDEDVTLYRYWNYAQSQTLYPFTFILETYESTQPNFTMMNISLLTYSYDSLDNAFEYSLETFTNDNSNLNNINFFGWFNGFFLNQSSSHNLLYLNFANWYMNYALLVSSGYLLFLALMWFINYVRRILDKSQNIDFGGF